MPTTTSFDAIWRALEDAVDEESGLPFEVSDHALWVETLRGDRKYELRLTMGAYVSTIITVEQDALNGAVDQGNLASTDAHPGGCSLYVEFCVIREHDETNDASMLRHIIDEFWPDVETVHSRLWETHSETPEERARETRHEHFSFVRSVGFEFEDRAADFIRTIGQTLEQLSAYAER